jgi:hypothetical protein
VIKLQNSIDTYNSLDEENKKLLLPVIENMMAVMLYSLSINQLASKHPTDRNMLQKLLVVLESFNRHEFEYQVAILKLSIEHMKYN